MLYRGKPKYRNSDYWVYGEYKEYGDEGVIFYSYKLDSSKITVEIIIDKNTLEVYDECSTLINTSQFRGGHSKIPKLIFNNIWDSGKKKIARDLGDIK